MKKILFVVLILSGLYFGTSCSNDFELTADWQDIPVVYALLSRADTAHYVRVEKAFLDPNTSALVQAQIADSIYYPDARLKLIRLSDQKEYNFTKVDGKLEGYPRDTDGPFASSPNWLYKLKIQGTDTLLQNEEYQLVLNRSEEAQLEPVTATITTVSDLEIKKPVENSILNFEYDDNDPDDLGDNFKVEWGFDKDNTYFFDAYLTFYYDENINGTWEPRSFVWQFGSNLLAADQSFNASVTLKGAEFYKNVAANIDESLDAPRRFRSIDFEIVAGGKSFFDYVEVNKVNTGITSSQLIPNFTNLSEGYGLFASRHSVKSIEHSLGAGARELLRNGIYTKNLNFQ